MTHDQTFGLTDLDADGLLALEMDELYWRLGELTREHPWTSDSRLGALIIRVALQRVRPESALRFYDKFEPLIDVANPRADLVEIYLLVAAYISTSDRTGQDLENHQIFSRVFANILKVAGYRQDYVWRLGGRYFTGSRNNPIVAAPGSSKDLVRYDLVVYRPDQIVDIDEERGAILLRAKRPGEAWN